VARMARAKQAPIKSAAGDGRSVNYPFITLEAAIAQARKLWDSVGRNMVPISTAAAAWGYGDKSSGVRSTVSALKQYGLLQDVGGAARRQIRLTDRALDILVEAIGSSKRTDALRAAVLAPRIYRDLFDRFQAGLPAQDHAISAFLLRDKEFNRKAVGGFIAGLRANLQFAALHLPPATDDAQAASHEPGLELRPTPARTPEDDRRGGDSHQDVFALGAEGTAVLQWPGRLSQESYNELSDWIELELKKIARLNGLKRRQAKN
jgi:hypothetical protein